MKKPLILTFAALVLSAAACGKAAAISVCEKKNTCEGTAVNCEAQYNSGVTANKCVAENDAISRCQDEKGACTNGVYYVGSACITEEAALVKCLRQ